MKYLLIISLLLCLGCTPCRKAEKNNSDILSGVTIQPAITNPDYFTVSIEYDTSLHKYVQVITVESDAFINRNPVKK